MNFPISLRHLKVYAMVVGVGFVALSLVFGVYRLAFKHRILPNVYIGSLKVGGLTPEVARDKVNARVLTIGEQGIPIYVDQKLERIYVNQTAYRVSIDEAVNRAWGYGQSGGLGTKLIESLTAIRVKQTMAPKIVLDDRVLGQEVAALAEIFDTPGRDVRLDIKGKEVGLLYDTASGQEINQADVERHLRRALYSLDVSPIHVRRIEVEPKIDATTAEAAKLSAEQMMAEDITFTDRGQSRTISRQTIGTWLDSSSVGTRLVANVNRKAISEYVAGLASEVNILPRNLGVELKDDKVVGFIAPRPGRVVKETETIERLVRILENRAASQSTSSAFDLPTEVKEAQTEGAASELGIKELIGRATTPFTGSPRNRISNIKNGARLLSGLIIKPGAEFSTLGSLGTIDNTTGYLPELVIKGNRTLPEFGGGLCQVSTTLFRAVMNAGLPITARQNHSYRVTYYEKDGEGHTIGPGLDATIYQPAPDFRFLNDTGSAILISGYVEGDRLTFDLYGTRDGRSALIDGPKLLSSTPPGDPINVETDTLLPGEKKQLEKPHPGGSATATYRITYSDGTIKEQVFKSFYRPWPAQFLVGVTKEGTTKPEGDNLPAPGSATVTTAG